MHDFGIVGAGVAGCVLAERIASQLGRRVVVVEKRSHIGGNAYDFHDEHGILVHKYGPHAFHTNHPGVVQYLSRFTSWRPYEHRALAEVEGKRVPIPINATTLNRLYGINLSRPDEVEAFYESAREPIAQPRNAKEAILARVGRDLYEKIFAEYTRKQWGQDPAALLPSLMERVAPRTSTDDRYFLDTYQAMPKDGYTSMFGRMLDHPNIELRLGTDFHRIPDDLRFRHLIYTGPIDRFFDHAHGRLPYRGLKLVHEHHECDYFQEVGQVNFPNTHDFTRITESKHFTGQQCPGTTLTYEYPVWPEQFDNEPYYPVPTEQGEALYRKYRDDAERVKSVTFCGRLAEYRYYNMDGVVARALYLFEHTIATIR